MLDKFKPETGEKSYCQIQIVSDNHMISNWQIDPCVKPTVAERCSEKFKNYR